MSYTVKSDDTYDVADFSGVLQQDSFQMEATTAITYYAKKPAWSGDTNVYVLLFSAGLPKVVCFVKGTTIYTDAGATTALSTAGKLYATHIGGN